MIYYRLKNSTFSNLRKPIIKEFSYFDNVIVRRHQIKERLREKKQMITPASIVAS